MFMRLCYRLFFLTGLIFFVEAQEKSLSEEKEKIIRLSLSDAIEMALRKNTDLEVQRLEVEISEKEITKSKGAFDTRLSAEYNDGDFKKETASALDGADLLERSTDGASIGLKKKVITGTELDLSIANERESSNSVFQTLNPSYEAQATLLVKQPLLKGFGLEVNKADTEIAKLNAKSSQANLKIELIFMLNKIEAAYWDLVARSGDVETKEAALKASQALNAINERKVKAGTQPRVDLLESSSAVASNEADLYEAERLFEDAQDDLVRLIESFDQAGPDEAKKPWQTFVVPTDQPLQPSIDIAEEASIDLALKKRSELIRAQVAIEVARINRKVAKNELKPDLSLTGSWSHTNLERNRSKVLKGLDDDEARVWEFGIQFEMPLGNREAKSNVFVSRTVLRQEQLRLESLRKNIVVEVRQAIRAIKTGQKRLEASQRAVTFSTEKLKVERSRFDQGLATTHDVLEALSDQTAQKSRLISAQVDYVKAISDWHKAQGTLLEEKGLVVE